jgi:hypothetical protein
MGKTLKYVSEFSFPADKGYSGSAGQQTVKGYARGGSCATPMKKAEGGMIERESVRFIPLSDSAKFSKAIGRGSLPSMIRGVARDMALSDFEEEGRRALDEARAARASQLTGERAPPRARSQGLRSPVAEMARERALMGEDAGYKKGGMAMRKQYPANNGKPLISGPKTASAPKADMLFSKKEVNAKNLLADGKAPSLPHAKGSVNMKNGGPVKPAPAKRPPNVAPPQPPVPVRMAAVSRPPPDYKTMAGGSPQDRMMNQAQMQAQMQAASQGGQSLKAGAQGGQQLGGPPSSMMNQAQMRAQMQAQMQAAAQGRQPPGRMMAKGGAAKVGKVMSEFKAGNLHSGSKSGPAVKSRKQAIAIGLSEARRGKK